MNENLINKLASVYKVAVTGENFLKGLALAGGLAVGGAVADTGISIISDKLRDRKKEEAFKAMVGIHPKLFSMDQERLKMYFDTLWNFAPDIAKDPLASGGVLSQAMQLDVYGGFPADILKNIVEVQNKRTESRSKSRGGVGDFLNDAGRKQVLPLFKD